MRELMVCIVLVATGCTAANPAFVAAEPDGAGALADQVRSPSSDLAGAPDLGEPATADLLPPAPAPDLAPAAADLSPASSPDLSPTSSPDLSPAPDLTPPPSCGGMGQPCCAGSCDAGMMCLYATDSCGGARPSVCTVPLNCGGPGLKCCTSLGQPTSIGYCESTASCSSGACRGC